LLKLGLIGKNISHSLSPALYREIIKSPFQYDLLDYSSLQELPKLNDLKSYFGLNITSPWKRAYLDQISDYPKKWKAINCLKNVMGEWLATNTDASALEELIPKLQQEYLPQKWIVLGDGVMANITLTILSEQGYNFESFARSRGDDLSQLGCLDKYRKSAICIINACSREYRIPDKSDASWVWWDYNYNNQLNTASTLLGFKAYLDGKELLNTQAKHAAMFWGLA
jgi:shikimate dehydrogenase